MLYDFQQRYDTSVNWTSNDPVLQSGVLGIESDTDRPKVGDGVTAWSGLTYADDPVNIFNKSKTVKIDQTGVNDAADYINDAIDFAHSNGKSKVLIPNGTYLIDKPIQLLSDMRLVGESMQKTILKVKTGSGINCIAPTTAIHNAEISNLQIDGNHEAGSAIKAWMDNSIIQYVKTVNIGNHALELNYTGSVTDDLGYLNKVMHCFFSDSAQEGIMWGWRMTDSWCMYNNVGSAKANLYLEGGSSRFIGNHFDGNPEYNVYIPDGCNVMLFSQNVIENAQKHCIYLAQPTFDSQNIDVSFNDNLIRAASTSDTGVYDLINIVGRSDTVRNDRIQITGNRLINPNTTKPRYCIYADNTDHLIATGNLFGGHSGSTPTSLTANCTDCLIANNVG